MDREQFFRLCFWTFEHLTCDDDDDDDDEKKLKRS